MPEEDSRGECSFCGNLDIDVAIRSARQPNVVICPDCVGLALDIVCARDAESYQRILGNQSLDMGGRT